MKLLLFDIDGTILQAGGSGRHAVEQALEEVIDRPINSWNVSYAGRTDPAIIRDVLIVNGCTPEEADAQLTDALNAYVRIAQSLLTSAQIQLMPGIVELLAYLHTHEDVQLGLLTGNLEPMAYAKLAAVGLDHYFPFGAFSSDHPDRYQLPPIAVERAYAHTGRHFKGKDVVIIGDTEHDIRCGAGIGVFSVGVATGRFSFADLEVYKPDLLLNDLSDRPAFLQHILGRKWRHEA